MIKVESVLFSIEVSTVVPVNDAPVIVPVVDKFSLTKSIAPLESVICPPVTVAVPNIPLVPVTDTL